MSYEYSEDGLIEQATQDVLEELGWQVVTAWQNERFGEAGLLGRENKSEVILSRYLLQAIEKLNPNLPKAAYDQAVELMKAGVRHAPDRCAISLIAELIKREFETLTIRRELRQTQNLLEHSDSRNQALLRQLKSSVAFTAPLLTSCARPVASNWAYSLNLDISCTSRLAEIVYESSLEHP